MRPLLGTFVEIELRAGLSARRLNAWIDRGFAEIEGVERLMSRFRAGSDVSRLNRARGWIEVDPLTAVVLRAAEGLRRRTAGAFDPGAAVELRGGRARRLGRGRIDLGGIAKGFAVDRAVAVLRRAPGARGVVNAGGDLRALGAPARAAVRLPGDPPRLFPFSLRDAAATSSTGLRPDVVHRARGRRVAPGRTAVALAPSCLLADALTKVALARA
jgi:thiamine biosynthesis lipoprotein